MAEHYKLEKLIYFYPNLSIIVEDILKKAKSNLIILFGSYAKFIAKKDSDIDLFIETTRRKQKALIESINSKIRVKIGKFDKTNLLIKEIIKDHIILKGVELFYEKTGFFKENL